MRIANCTLVILTVLLSACNRHGSAELGEQVTAGDPKIGEHLIYSYGCGSCHVIPGIPEATGTVGPSLQRIGSRIYIAGILVNTPGNLFRWISKPQQVYPEAAMPDLGVTERQAHDIAAYLYTLQ